MASIKWVGQHIEADQPKRPKKITGTRLAAIMGANKWSTPFQAWCEITKTYQMPFEGTIYTEAGKTIEPKQAQFMKDTYFMSNLITPADKYGEDYFSKTYGDFFHHVDRFGGMWDYLLCDADGNPTTVLEMKTTKRAEDWVQDVPNYYAIQAALYAWLLGVDNVLMVCSFLEEKDYKDPSAYVPTTDNTIVVPFKVSERYPQFDQLILEAQTWWDKYVATGISPDYDERRDADYLKELRKISVAPDQGMNDLLNEADRLESILAEYAEKTKEYEDRLKVIKEAIKEDAKGKLTDGETAAVYECGKHTWSVTMTTKAEVKLDEKAMKADGVFDKYAKTSSKTTYTLRVSNKEE